jgi:cytochrome c
MWRRCLILFGMAALGTTGCAPPGHAPRDATPRFRALVFSKTAGFRHSSIPNAIAAIQGLGTQHTFAVDPTEDATIFTDSALAKYQVVIFALTTGDVLTDAQQDAFVRFIRSGRGYVGVHSASDTEHDWPWYGGLVGAYFAGHGAIEPATLTVADRPHPATAGLPAQWARTDEWYTFKSNPRERVHVLATLDESSTETSKGMGADHPIAWCHEYDGGRAFYTAGGHTEDSYAEPIFVEHLLRGIETAAGARGANCNATQTASFEKVTLDSAVRSPMELDIAKDGRVIYVERHGRVRLIKSDGAAVTLDSLAVFSEHEFGLLGVALDPQFTSNGWAYLYYSPAGTKPVNRLSRFTVEGDRLKPGSEAVLLEVDVQREQCCHVAGALVFDAKGDLLIATGDNTNPFASDGYSPLDERPGKAAFDAQRSAANSNSLSGKLLRITPKANGTYRIPKGNLFAPGTPKTRPEIYAMGLRNPFRIGLDPATNAILVADYGPDADKPDTLRGPDGRVEWTIVDRPGFYGWPYCVGYNTPYRDYDFATGHAGRSSDCAGGPTNDSPNNTGLTKLPPAIPATVWMGRRTGSVAVIGGSGAPTAGGVYRFDAGSKSKRKWPEYWNATAILGDWNDGRLFALQLDTSGTRLAGAHPMFTGMRFHKPHALKFGPDGALYVIDWGMNWGGIDSAGVFRVDYAPGKRPQMIAQGTRASTEKASSATAAPALDLAVAAGPPPACRDGERDDFEGDQLNRKRWTTVVRENQNLRVAGGALIIPTSATDIYGGGNTTTNIVLRGLPDGAWVATAKLALAARRGYQQAGLIVYGDDDNYAKMVFQARDPSNDNAEARIFQFIREEQGDPKEAAESNTGNLGAAHSDTVWVRFYSNGKTLRAAHSANGTNFIDMPDTKSLDGMTDPKIGLVALASGYGPPPVIEAKFDWFELCQPEPTQGAAGSATPAAAAADSGGMR